MFSNQLKSARKSLVVAAGLTLAAAAALAAPAPAAAATATAAAMSASSGPELASQATGAARAVASPVLAFATPIRGFAVNSVFGLRRLSYERRARMHEGLDYAAPTGSPVLAAADGVVVGVGRNGSYGRFIEIEHAEGVTSYYAHLSAAQVAEGARVSAGDPIGKVGSTGRVTGPHLHFEIRHHGEQVDPQQFLGRSVPLDQLANLREGAKSVIVSRRTGPSEPVPYGQLTRVTYR